MAVYKEDKTGTWRVIYRYTDWNGERKQTQKRGFKTRREAQAWEHKLHTLDDLENRLALLHTEIDEVKADLDARHARMKELRELITCTEQYERFKPLYDELCSIKWKSKREQFKSEYESELRQFYMARRKLRGGIHIAEWRRELAMLERESNAAYAKYKAPRDELSELLDVKYCIVHALAAREAKGRVSRPLNKLQPERE